VSRFLGIDTSNYTTSAALYDDENGEVISSRKLLDVPEGTLGLRQSDALFSHVTRLPEIIGGLGETGKIFAVGVSAVPRETEGSYMPCFLAGVCAADTFARLSGIPYYTFSHQQGHIAAGAWSAGEMELLNREFLALHVSGGTTDLLHVTPGASSLTPECLFKAEHIGGTSDLTAGQLVDRCGKLLGITFPAGKVLEELAGGSGTEEYFIARHDGLKVSFSGLENKLKILFDQNATHSDIARYTLNSIGKTLLALLKDARHTYQNIPILCVGGVMSDALIKRLLMPLGGIVFSSPAYSSDNAAGAAILASVAFGKTNLKGI
jgi:N6-L-threonylcarbamoyladenine synthase